MCEQFVQAFEIVLGCLGCFVGMNAGRSIEERIFPGELDGRLAADRHHPLHTCIQCTLDHLFAVRVKFLAIEVAVRVDHFRRAPTGTSSRNPARTGLPPSSEAATIMPFDSMPRSLRA